YGAATGRPRRVGPFDAVASKYGIRIQGADEIALTKLDVLDGYEEIDICVAYELDGKIMTEFPTPELLDRCKPVFETVKGWNTDISGCRKEADLPVAAKEYINTIEELVGAKIKYVSVGAERDAIIIR
ncbi:MAG: adenylosuccinate synthetase, partial [Clostridia bacterium]|nr:adenylosuccinate synthetase [Clostridia bacterium]